MSGRYIFSSNFVFVKYFDIFMRVFGGLKHPILIKSNINMAFCTDKREIKTVEYFDTSYWLFVLISVILKK
jgi:hypothetical protein